MKTESDLKVVQYGISNGEPRPPPADPAPSAHRPADARNDLLGHMPLPAHQRKVRNGHRARQVVDAATADVQSFRLFGDRQIVLTVDHRFALSKPALPSAPSKKSFSSVSAPTMQTFITQGNFRALAVMTKARLKTFADIPAISEAGFGDDLEVMAWQGVLVRTGTPREVIATLNNAIVQAMKDSATRERIAAIGVEPMATSPEAFDAFFKAEVARWTDVAQRAGLKAQ